ncbi:GNAT family N-acetyltransferase [Bacillus salitolerans]|uniref:GNAT family N-acetyltransferase n=1 Tax=Bacillus salitolerans TaxID=1437434 RepID=A0ABW4LRC1_9BACI
MEFFIKETITDQDYIDCAFVTNQLSPKEPISPDVLKESKAHDPNFSLWVARFNHEVVGSAVCAPSSSPGQAFAMLRVLPNWRGKGIGELLYEQVSKHARSLSLFSLQGRVRESEDHTIDFLTKRGFKEVTRESKVILNLLAVEEKIPLQKEGIEVVSLNGREDLWQGAYEVALESIPDIPMPEPLTVPPFDKWVETQITSGEVLLEGSFVAKVDGMVIGYAGLSKMTASHAENLLTGVKRKWRGQGIAKLMKETQIQWAMKKGFTKMITFMDHSNQPILKLNEHLGYEAEPSSIVVRGPLSSSL